MSSGQRRRECEYSTHPIMDQVHALVIESLLSYNNVTRFRFQHLRLVEIVEMEGHDTLSHAASENTGTYENGEMVEQMRTSTCIDIRP